ncbi:MAG: hypothetical protein NTU94_12495 [Planctomycetota bacterium]|nr:hypothetical protein [Planctomycetota bacterium]
MITMSLHDQWRRGYAVQARADLETLDLLSRQPVDAVPKCHRLQFLQMACEKLVKAHLLDIGTYTPDRLRIHTVTAKHLPPIMNEYYRRQTGRSMPPHLYQRVGRMAREIELLAPAADDDGRQPANCEYPWPNVAGNQVYVPAEYAFRSLDLPREPALHLILKVLPIAIHALAAAP